MKLYIDVFKLFLCLTIMFNSQILYSQDDTSDDSNVERIEVTGSRIKRIDIEGPSPVKIIDKSLLENSAYNSVSDVLREMNIASFGINREASGSSAVAVSSIGLRGLGSSRTLVLLNGKRLVKDPAVEAVDLNMIPIAAVERIEVLKDGASAVYGSDALGGVINIITKKNYSGSEVAIKVTRPEEKGGENTHISLVTGTSTGKSSHLVVLNYKKNEKVFGRDREFSKEGESSHGSPGSYHDGTSWVPDPLCPPDLIKDVLGGQRCHFRYNEIATTLPTIEQINLLSEYSYKINANLEFSNRITVGFRESQWLYAPAPGIFTTPSGTTTVPTAERVSYRFVEAGNRDNLDTDRNYGTQFGLKGYFGSTWQWDTSLGYSRAYRENLGYNGYLDVTVLQQLIADGDFDPLAPAGSRGSVGSAQVQTLAQAESQLFTGDLVFSGELMDMPNGPLSSAFGYSFFEEKLDQKTDPKSASGVVIGSSGSNDKGAREVHSVFSEFSIPLGEKLEGQLAARYDKYSDFGSTVNPKIALRYVPNNWLLIRSSVGTGFKAPTLSQLYGSASDGFITFIDRKACETDAAACSPAQYHVFGGGNKDLEEEKALTASLGFVIEPNRDFNLSLDVWYTQLDNVVGIDYEEMTKAEIKGVNPADHGVTVDRSSGEIVVTAINLNLQESEVAGADLNFEKILVSSLFGKKFGIANEFSFILFYKEEGFPGAGKRDTVGEFGQPQWRNSVSLFWKDEVTMLEVAARTIAKQKAVDSESGKSISDYTEVDLSGSYNFSWNGALTLGLKNVLGTTGPVDPVGNAGGTPLLNSSLYDPNGRRAFLAYRQSY